MSNLVSHAEFELRRAGLFDKDSDYAGMLGEATMKLIRLFAGEGHSGASAGLATELFCRLSRYKTLTPLTNDPAEWRDVSGYGGGNPAWQSLRDPSMFSDDGGKTRYSVDDPKRTIVTCEEKK